MCHKYSAGSGCNGSSDYNGQCLVCLVLKILFFNIFRVQMLHQRNLTYRNVVSLPQLYWFDLFSFTWAFPPFDLALFDLWNLWAGITKGRWVLEDLPYASLLATLEATGSSGPRTGAPLAPLTHFAVHCRGGNGRRQVRVGNVFLNHFLWLNAVALLSTSSFAICSHIKGKKTWHWLRPSGQASLAVSFFFWRTHWTDLVACTPWVCHWARSPLDTHGGTYHWADTGLAGTVYMSHCSRMTHTLQGTLQRQKRSHVFVSILVKFNTKAWFRGTVTLSTSENCLVSWTWLHVGMSLRTHWEHTPSVCRWGPGPRGSSPGTCPGEGRSLLGSACRSFCWSRSRTPTCTLREKHRPNTGVYLNCTSYRVCHAC